ncbi:TonB-dependent receptor [Belliella sp. DSM 111904]|uniref:TonB-dependent receptor n=1 Tax=Belliella filtrata TaxID=2923435 RepID=A0ABS9UZC1_9BACT|nr:TonB-dependent receptor [Belliella filtrata]MCH7409499.1 TonB-dependent receptor [Belliella filtrata]
MRGILTFFLLIISNYAIAQKSQLSGVVFDENLKSLEGATVQLISARLVVLTDQQGKFNFSGPFDKNDTLLIAHLGFETLEIVLSSMQEERFLKVKLKPSDQLLSEVMIEANTISHRKQEDAMNIEIVRRNFIQKNLGGSLMQSLERLPGISSIGIGSGQSKPLIRGLGFNRVVVLDKGVKHEGQQWGADHGLELDQFAAEEVALIKGAASFIYGSDAIGGAINVKPARPPVANTFGGSVDVIAKSNNNLYGTSVNLYARKNRLFFDTRLTYQRYGDYRVPTDIVHVYDFPVSLSDNYLRNTAGLDKGFHIQTGYITEKLKSIFYLSHIHGKSGFFANAHGLEPRRVDTKLHDSSNRDILMPSQHVDHYKIINRSDFNFGEHQIEMELGYQWNFRQEYSPYVNHGYMPPVYPADMNVSSVLERAFDKKVYSINMRDIHLLGKHEFTFGINSEYQDNAIGGWGFLVPAFTQLTSGAFLYDKFSINEKLMLHGAIRYDYGHINTLEYTDWFTSDITTPDGEEFSENIQRAASLSRSFNSLVWSAGLNYNLERFQVKANIGKSFRMPIAKELAANGVNYHYFSYERGNPKLSPEESYQADLGINWTRSKWTIQLSPFLNYFSNYIYLNPTPDHDYYYGAGNQVFEYTQSQVLRYGGEIQLGYALFKNLTSALLGEYVYSYQLSGDKKGYTLPFSPPPSLILNLTWSPEIKRFFQDTYFSFDYRITAKQHHIVPPERKTPGYQVINVQLGTKLQWNNRPFLLSVQAQNLLNTRYLNHTSFYRLIALPEAGRNIVINLSIPFTKQTKLNKNGKK